MKRIKTLIKKLSSLEKLIILAVVGLIATVTYNTYTNTNASAYFFRSVLGESSENSSEFSDEESFDEGSSEDSEESSVSELSELSEDSELSEFSEESSENSIWLFRLFEQGRSPVEESEISEESIDGVSQEESSEFSELGVAEDMIDELQSSTRYRTTVTKRFLFLIPVNIERVIETDDEGKVVSEKQTFFYRILDILSF